MREARGTVFKHAVRKGCVLEEETAGAEKLSLQTGAFLDPNADLRNIPEASVALASLSSRKSSRDPSADGSE